MRTKELYIVKDLPVFQNKMYETLEDAKNCPKGDIRLVQDLDTGLIFNQDFDGSLMVYDRNYQNEQAHSKVFQEHLKNVRSIIDRCFISKEFIEVGCGKGYFLEYMAAFGFEVTGFDPTYEGNNPNIIKEYFDPTTTKKSQGIVLRHVLEHIQAPYEFLKKIAKANNDQGLIYIEVPCFDWICEHNAWFDIFYEHVNYFRLDDFHRMFGNVVESGNIFGGQYLYIVADLSSLQEPSIDDTHHFSFPDTFLSELDNISALAKEQKNVVWGGASKGVIFSLYMQKTGVNIDYIVDINPSKQGRYLPASGLQVSSPEEIVEILAPKQNIFVMNSNYLEEIADITNHRFNYIKVD